MAATGTTKKKRRQHSFSVEGSQIKDELNFRLDDVIKLGGTREDYERLREVKDRPIDVAHQNNHEKCDDIDLKSEIQDLVESLGLDTITMEDDDDEIIESEEESMNCAAENSANGTRTENMKAGSIFSVECGVEKRDIYIPKFVNLKKILIKQGALWHEQIPDSAYVKSVGDIEYKTVSKIQEIARQFWENEVELYQEKKNNEKSSDANWLRTVMSSGTMSDRVAASTMLLQESPVHELKRMESLISMAKKKGRREAIMAIESLRNLWTTTLLPERKLKHFWQWPIADIQDFEKDSGMSDEACLLVLWYFEDLLKSKCDEFVGVLESLSRDTIPGIRDKTAGIMFELLTTKAEQEQRLLTAIVNKLGDPARKVASRASYLLGQLVIKHPNMKMIVIQEVERLIYRPNVSKKAQYYAICFLNQLILSKTENLVASKLISIYFSFFKAYATDETSDTKMLSALLSGVNRAFPYTRDREDNYADELNMLFKICHTASFPTSLQALMLLFQVMESKKTVTDRYYNVLYEKLLDVAVNTTNKRTMFLNIIFKSMKSDTAINRVKAFFKRLLQVSSCHEPNFVCGLLYLLSEILNLKPGIKGLIMQPEDDDDVEHFEDINADEFTAPNESAEDKKIEIAEQLKSSEPKRGWTFHGQESKRSEYEPSYRNPLFCGAQLSSAWELHPLLRHFHPSVNRFAESMLRDKALEYKGDPLQDFTLVRFLDRFMYKNPKNKTKEHGTSIMQPRKISERSKEVPVNSKSFTDTKLDNIREDEIFFYRFFKRKSELEEAKKGKRKKQDLIDRVDNNDEEELNADDFDFASEIDKAKIAEPKNKKKQAKGLNDSDEEEYMSDREDFRYSDMEFSEDEDFEENFENEINTSRKKHFTDADYEKALFENLSDSDVNEDTDDYEKCRRSNENVSSMFAAADEFAHLLEGSEKTKGQKKQSNWEAKNGNWNSKRKFEAKKGSKAGDSWKLGRKASEKHDKMKKKYSGVNKSRKKPSRR